MILAGDVGGTKVRLALFEEKGGIKFVDEQKFASREFPDLSTLLKKFLENEKGKKISVACFGVAGPVKEGKCKATNLPWEISAKVLEKDLNIPKVNLINDLEANAWGLRCLSPEEFYTINGGVESIGNQALVSAGTGLGEAGLYWDGKSHRPFACEGGHCDFAPTNDEEIDLLNYLMKLHKHVSYERVLSGPGLYQIYRFLIDTNREKEDPSIAALMQVSEGPRVITEKGGSGECRACARACRIFVELYGSEAGNMALKFFAIGGVFIGGGIAPHLLPFIKEGNFIKTFIDKGRLSSVLLQIPVKLVLNEKTALLGAARFAQENR
ncbi:MAG: glucokinase [Verrucomicrobia bacterium]|nr:glucokinase [Verrucomicrobiota bacterium]